MADLQISTGELCAARTFGGKLDDLITERIAHFIETYGSRPEGINIRSSTHVQKGKALDTIIEEAKAAFTRVTNTPA